MMRSLTVILAAGLLAGCSAFGIRSGTEAPAYRVIEAPAEALEVRRYGPRVAAEASVAADDVEEGRDGAFRLLFDYISGANRSAARIAMTAPVETTADGAADGGEAGEEIAMTVPVETAEEAPGRLRMRFFLPAAYGPETAPEPLDPRVRIVALPEQTLAALRFTGSRSEARVAAETAALLRALEGTRWRPTAEPVAQFYDPPWTLPFLRRNEVVVAVTR